MRLTIDLPDDVVERLAADPNDPSREVLESVALEGCRSRRLSDSQVMRLLGFETRMEVDAFLKAAGIPLDYTMEDLERERGALRRLGV